MAITFTCYYQAVDLVLAPVGISLDRYEAVEFSGFIGGDSTCLLVRYPEATLSSSSALEVFNVHVSRPRRPSTYRNSS